MKDILLIVLTLAVLFLCVQVYLINSSMAELWSMFGDILSVFTPGRNI